MGTTLNRPRIQQYRQQLQVLRVQPSENITYLIDKNNKKDEFLLKQMCANDRKSVSAIESELEFKAKLVHPNTCTLKDFYLAENEQFCSKFTTIGVLYQFPTKTLNDRRLQVIAKNNSTLKQKGGFKSEQLWSILKQVASGMSFLQRNQIHHSSVRSTNIYCEHGSQLRVKVADPSIRGLPTNYEIVRYKRPADRSNRGRPTSISCASDDRTIEKHEHGVYLSPAELNSCRQQQQNPTHNPYKSDVFAFAIVMLELVFMRTQQDLYTPKGKAQLNVDLLSRRLQEARKVDTFSLCQVLEKMCLIDQSARSDWVGLEVLINQLQTKSPETKIHPSYLQAIKKQSKLTKNNTTAQETNKTPAFQHSHQQQHLRFINNKSEVKNSIDQIKVQAQHHQQLRRTDNTNEISIFSPTVISITNPLNNLIVVPQVLNPPSAHHPVPACVVSNFPATQKAAGQNTQFVFPLYPLDQRLETVTNYHITPVSQVFAPSRQQQIITYQPNILQNRSEVIGKVPSYLRSHASKSMIYSGGQRNTSRSLMEDTPFQKCKTARPREPDSHDGLIPNQVRHNQQYSAPQNTNNDLRQLTIPSLQSNKTPQHSYFQPHAQNGGVSPFSLAQTKKNNYYRNSSNLTNLGLQNQRQHTNSVYRLGVPQSTSKLGTQRPSVLSENERKGSVIIPQPPRKISEQEAQVLQKVEYLAHQLNPQPAIKPRKTICQAYDSMQTSNKDTPLSLNCPDPNYIVKTKLDQNSYSLQELDQLASTLMSIKFSSNSKLNPSITEIDSEVENSNYQTGVFPQRNRTHNNTANSNRNNNKKSSQNSNQNSQVHNNASEYVQEQFNQGVSYQGQKVNNMRHGKGRFYYNDGGMYEGDWFNNEMQGFGRLFYGNGNLAYEGEWRADHFHGAGKLHNQNPKYIEQFDYADFGKVGEYWKYYEGQFRKDLKHGQGVLVLQNGQKLQATWKNDQVHGNGVFTTKFNQVFHGIWRQNKLTRIIVQ